MSSQKNESMADHHLTVSEPIDDLGGPIQLSDRCALTVEAIDSLAEAEPIWRELEIPVNLWTPYQRFAFQAAWFNTIGRTLAASPLIIVVRDEDKRPLMLLPLIVTQLRGSKIASYFGGSHVTYNMPLMQRHFAERAGREDIEEIINGIHAAAPDIDILNLERQPTEWAGIANPMAVLPGQPSPTPCPMMVLQPDSDPTTRISNSYRRRLRSKERKLQAQAGYRYTVANDHKTGERLLTAFFEVKRQHMAEQKLPDVFGSPAVVDFIMELAKRQVAGEQFTLEVHALECDAEVIAVSAGVANEQCFSVMFGTYTSSENAKFSPGVILMRYLIDGYAERKVATIDFGIGDDEYKRQFCRLDHILTDSYVALSSRGRLGVMTLSGLTRAKRLVKKSPTLKKIAARIRYMITR